MKRFGQFGTRPKTLVFDALLYLLSLVGALLNFLLLGHELLEAVRNVVPRHNLPRGHLVRRSAALDNNHLFDFVRE